MIDEMDGEYGFFGPTFEEADDSMAIQRGQYIFSIEKGEIIPSKSSDGFNFHLTFKVAGGDGSEGLIGRQAQTWIPIAGKMAFKLDRLIRQCGLQEIHRYFAVKMDEYLGDDERPKFKDQSDEVMKRIGEFYMSGVLVDDAGKEFRCDSGGLQLKRVEMKVGKPRVPKGMDEEQTGDLIPVKV